MVSAPLPINASLTLEHFNCGYYALDEWLKKKALHNEQNRASRTFVVVEDDKVIGYYTLSLGALRHKEVSAKQRRNMPDPLPAILLGRLAVDVTFQGQGIGSGLLKDAILRTLRVSVEAGVRLMFVHALDNKAAHFYKEAGFIKSPLHNLLMMLDLNTLK